MLCGKKDVLRAMSSRQILPWRVARGRKELVER